MVSTPIYTCRRCGQTLYAWLPNNNCNGDYLLHHDIDLNEIKIAPPPPEDLNLQEIAMTDFVTKDSGQRQEFSTGMVRDTSTNKARYDLVDVPMLTRWAELMARGAKKYGANNWRKASTQEELDRFKESAFRHFMQWFGGATDEDHGAAVFFNVAGAEMVKNKIPPTYLVPASANVDLAALRQATCKIDNIRPIHG